jgi:hypothetical protein
MSVLVGFSKVNLMDVLPEDKPCSMPILGIGFYLEQEEKKSFFFTVDFMDFDFATVSTLTTAISKELPQAQIHIVTTHNHGGESCTSLDMEKFCLHAKECAKTAIKNSQKAKVKIATASIDEKLTFTRRIFVPTLDSSFTCFYGIDTQKENNAANFVERVIESLKNNALLFTGNGSTENQNNSSITFFDADPNISVIEFQTLNNQPIGNIVRFASHAVCCNLPDCYSSDFPGYLRKNMENSLGGISLFFNGPCAEIAPVIPCKSIDAAKKIADILSQKALELLEKTSFSNLEDISDTIWQIPLPVREEIINNNGLVISEYPLGTKPLRYHFPARNRIISGLSDSILVVEARKNSGTNITVDFALEQGKDVFVIPGNIYSKTSEGTNFLITEGAIPILSYKDILSD